MSNGSPSLGPILITGGNGMLAAAWRKLLDNRQIDYTTPSENDLDITEPKSVARHVTDKFPIVINCAAYTDVDGAETNIALAEQINGEAVGVLARRCSDVGSLLVHFSTDYVFNGQASKPYAVDEPTDPINAYGQSKLSGEQAMQNTNCRFLLIRTSWLYAPWGKNFVHTIANLVSKRDELSVVDDQRGRPTSAEHLAATTLALLERDATGIYHVTDGGECTWYEFAQQIGGAVNPACKIAPCTSDAFPRPAKRPRYSVLDISYVESTLGPMPDWQKNVADVLRRLE